MCMYGNSQKQDHELSDLMRQYAEVVPSVRLDDRSTEKWSPQQWRILLLFCNIAARRHGQIRRQRKSDRKIYAHGVPRTQFNILAVYSTIRKSHSLP